MCMVYIIDTKSNGSTEFGPYEDKLTYNYIKYITGSEKKIKKIWKRCMSIFVYIYQQITYFQLSYSFLFFRRESDGAVVDVEEHIYSRDALVDYFTQLKFYLLLLCYRVE